MGAHTFTSLISLGADAHWSSSALRNANGLQARQIRQSVVSSSRAILCYAARLAAAQPFVGPAVNHNERPNSWEARANETCLVGPQLQSSWRGFQSWGCVRRDELNAAERRRQRAADACKSRRLIIRYAAPSSSGSSSSKYFVAAVGSGNCRSRGRRAVRENLAREVGENPSLF
jgi:hypothetical protein